MHAEGAPAPASETTPAPTRPDRHDVRAFFRSALGASPGRVLAIAVPAPAGDGLHLLDALRRGNAFHLHDDARSLTTLGASRELSLRGASRFADAARFVDDVQSGIRRVAHDAIGELSPVLTLGLAFAAGRARDAWSAFGDGVVTLPRWAHRVGPVGASLVFVRGVDEPNDPALALAELDAIWDALEASRETLHRARAARALVKHVERDRWARSIDDVTARIADGRAKKIVVARRSTITADHDFEPVAVARRLERPGAHVFCVRRAGAAFVGATPEHLFRKRKLRVLTEAVAGTVSLELDPRGRTLLSSAKDQLEHVLVVDAIASALGKLGARVDVSPSVLRTIGSIAHLATPIHATLARDLSPIALVEALHPTPAVAGVPREAALEWIGDHEPDRGWYAGPLGWMDLDGHAEMLVALRSALLSGSRAIAYAGCGIVEGSSADAEYAETELKLAPMLGALGAR
jgi:isochorismate synthase